MQRVHLVINLGQLGGGRAVPLMPAVRRPVPHAAGKLAHPLNEPAAARRQFRGEQMACPRRDLAFQVVGALQFRRDPQHGHQEPQVRGDRRLQQDLPAYQLLDLTVEGVDGPIPLGQPSGNLVAAAQQRLSHPGQIFANRGEQLNNLDVDRIQLARELTTLLGHSHPLGARLPQLAACKRPYRGSRGTLITCDVDLAPGTVPVDLRAAQSAMQTGPTIRRIHGTRRSPREP